MHVLKMMRQATAANLLRRTYLLIATPMLGAAG